MGSSGKNDSSEMTDLKKMKVLLPHWVVHNQEHNGDYGRWMQKAKLMGMDEVARELQAAVEKINHANEHLASAAKLVLEQGDDVLLAQAVEKKNVVKHSAVEPQAHVPHDDSSMDVTFKTIGVIHTPNKDKAPYQPVEDDSGVFLISLQERFAPALKRLDEFVYIYVLYHIHKAEPNPPMVMTPSWAGGVEVGTFASRSPLRPNPIGLSIVKIRKIEGSIIWTSGLDAFDGTPVLDIKPYIKELDSKSDANYGWVSGLDDYEHLLLHIKGIPHDY